MSRTPTAPTAKVDGLLKPLRQRGIVSAEQAEFYKQEWLRRPAETEQVLVDLAAAPTAGQAGSDQDMRRLGFPGVAR